MSIKADDLAKFSDLMTLMNGWVTDAAGVGVTLTGVTVRIGSNQNELVYVVDPPNDPYWEIV